MADQPPNQSSNAGRIERAALAMLAGWMSDRYYRTFRLADAADRGPFDAILGQRELRAGVTVGALWEDDATPAHATVEALAFRLPLDQRCGQAILLFPGRHELARARRDLTAQGGVPEPGAEIAKNTHQEGGGQGSREDGPP